VWNVRSSLSDFCCTLIGIAKHVANASDADYRAHQAQGVENTRAPVHQVADENRLASGRRHHPADLGQVVAELLQEHHQLVVATMNIHTAEGFLYLAAVMDLCSRKIVGWSMAEHLRAELCTEALHMAIRTRKPGSGLLHHSDRGVQYACAEYQKLLGLFDIGCSMSRVGNCYDNAAMESFWGTLKTERVYQEKYLTREEARTSIFVWIEGWYNRRRRHSALGYKSPEAFEAGLN